MSDFMEEFKEKNLWLGQLLAMVGDPQPSDFLVDFGSLVQEGYDEQVAARGSPHWQRVAKRERMIELKKLKETL